MKDGIALSSSIAILLMPTMRRKNWKSGPAFDRLLRTFVELFGDFGTAYWGFSIERGAVFGANSRIASVLDALKDLGLLELKADGFVWSDCVAPMMIELAYWPEPADEDSVESHV